MDHVKVLTDYTFSNIGEGEITNQCNSGSQNIVSGTDTT